MCVRMDLQMIVNYLSQDDGMKFLGEKLLPIRPQSVIEGMSQKRGGKSDTPKNFGVFWSAMGVSLFPLDIYSLYRMSFLKFD